jgi:hypothetical protein
VWGGAARAPAECTGSSEADALGFWGNLEETGCVKLRVLFRWREWVLGLEVGWTKFRCDGYVGHSILF